MKVFITGVAGFIGSNLANELLRLKHEVIGIDNMSYGNFRNINQLLNNHHFKFIFGDIANPYNLKDVEADVLVHLASQKIPRYSSALRTLDENYLMLKNVVNKCHLDNQKIVFASTSDVYGKNPNLPFSENSDLVMGSSKRWSYALSKIYGEQFIIANHEEYGLTYSIARFFGSYGPNHNLTWWGGPQSVFITKALNKEEIEIHGDGLQTRTFTYIDDTVNGLINLIVNEKSNNEIFNIGSNPDSEISILDLAKLIWKFINGEEDIISLKFIPYSNFGNYEDVRKRLPNLQKIKSFFNYEPKVSLKEGLIKTINWQKNILNL
jgi:UDP-glucose 4-epimerase